MWKFSVILPIYKVDHPVFLKLAVDSILNQTRPADEILLVIDGPIDDELTALVKQYENENKTIRVLWLPVNGGLGAALAAGVVEARFEFIARMDADDISLPHRFEKQIAAFESEPELDLLSAPWMEFEREPSDAVTTYMLPCEPSDIRSFAKRYNPINHPVAMFKKSAVLEAGNYRHFERHEDYYLWVRMLMNGARVRNLSEPLLYYRLNEDNFKRRRNWGTFKAGVAFHGWLYNVKFASFLDVVVPLSLAFVTLVVPVGLYQFLYENFWVRIRKNRLLKS